MNTLKVIRDIEAARSFPTRESPLCDWCEYYKVCPGKQHRRHLQRPGVDIVLSGQPGIRNVEKGLSLFETILRILLAIGRGLGSALWFLLSTILLAPGRKRRGWRRGRKRLH